MTLWHRIRDSAVWRGLFAPAEDAAAALALYRRIVAQSRRPEFYIAYRVADSLDGRFDVTALHVFLVLRRLKGEAARGLSQTLFDAFFEGLDDGLREMGVGDLAVGKKIRQMAEAFYGRVAAYDDGLAESHDETLKAALARNLYRGSEIPDNILNDMAKYVRRQADHLSGQSLAALKRGEATFEAIDGDTKATQSSATGTSSAD